MKQFSQTEIDTANAIFAFVSESKGKAILPQCVVVVGDIIERSFIIANTCTPTFRVFFGVCDCHLPNDIEKEIERKEFDSPEEAYGYLLEVEHLFSDAIKGAKDAFYGSNPATCCDKSEKAPKPLSDKA